MSQDISQHKEIAAIRGHEETPVDTKQPSISLEELVGSIKNVQQDIGQICELTSEEKRLVMVLFEALSNLMQRFVSSIPVSIASLPKTLGSLNQANMDPRGQLILIYENGEIDLRDLRKETERDLMICVIKDVIPKLKQLTESYRRKIEDRVGFLSSITNEMQKLSKALSSTMGYSPEE